MMDYREIDRTCIHYYDMGENLDRETRADLQIGLLSGLIRCLICDGEGGVIHNGGEDIDKCKYYIPINDGN